MSYGTSSSATPGTASTTSSLKRYRWKLGCHLTPTAGSRKWRFRKPAFPHSPPSFSPFCACFFPQLAQIDTRACIQHVGHAPGHPADLLGTTLTAKTLQVPRSLASIPTLVCPLFSTRPPSPSSLLGMSPCRSHPTCWLARSSGLVSTSAACAPLGVPSPPAPVSSTRTPDSLSAVHSSDSQRRPFSRERFS